MRLFLLRNDFIFKKLNRSIQGSEIPAGAKSTQFWGDFTKIIPGAVYSGPEFVKTYVATS